MKVNIYTYAYKTFKKLYLKLVYLLYWWQTWDEITKTRAKSGRKTQKTEHKRLGPATKLASIKQGQASEPSGKWKEYRQMPESLSWVYILIVIQSWKWHLITLSYCHSYWVILSHMRRGAAQGHEDQEAGMIWALWVSSKQMLIHMAFKNHWLNWEHF